MAFTFGSGGGFGQQQQQQQQNQTPGQQQNQTPAFGGFGGGSTGGLTLSSLLPRQYIDDCPLLASFPSCPCGTELFPFHRCNSIPAFGSTTPATGFGQQPQQQSTGLFGGGGGESIILILFLSSLPAINSQKLITIIFN